MTDKRGRPGYHDPLAGVGGAAPAQSALTLRLVLAVFGAVVFSTAAASAWWWDESPVIVTVCAVLALVALIDIVVVARRKARGEPG